jgi:hypothetical protein
MTDRVRSRRHWSQIGRTGALLLVGCGHSPSGAHGTALDTTDDVRVAYDAALDGLDRQYFDSMEMSSSTAMSQVLVVSADKSDQMLAEWEGNLAAGAAGARLTHPSRLSHVDGFEHATGDAAPEDPAYGYAVGGHSVTAAATDSEIEEQVASVLRDFRLTPTTVRVLHPLGPAVVVEATAAEAASVDGRMGELEHALSSSRMSGLDGLYVAVSGPDGPLFRGETSARIAEGGQWFAKGFDSGIPHG